MFILFMHSIHAFYSIHAMRPAILFIHSTAFHLFFTAFALLLLIYPYFFFSFILLLHYPSIHPYPSIPPSLSFFLIFNFLRILSILSIHPSYPSILCFLSILSLSFAFYESFFLYDRRGATATINGNGNGSTTATARLASARLTGLFKEKGERVQISKLIGRKAGRQLGM